MGAQPFWNRANQSILARRLEHSVWRSEYRKRMGSVCVRTYAHTLTVGTFGWIRVQSSFKLFSMIIITGQFRRWIPVQRAQSDKNHTHFKNKITNKFGVSTARQKRRSRSAIFRPFAICAPAVGTVRQLSSYFYAYSKRTVTHN